MKQKNNNQNLRSAFGWLGGLIILVGGIFLISQMHNISLGARLWPLRIVVPGVALFFGTLFMDEEIGPALAIVSGLTTMSGVILLIHVLTGYWATWPYSWTLLFPTAIGFGMLAYGVGKNKRELRRAGWSLTKIGLALFLLFAVFFEFLLGIGGFGLDYGWPLLVIALGFLIVTVSDLNLKQIQPDLLNGSTKHH